MLHKELLANLLGHKGTFIVTDGTKQASGLEVWRLHSDIGVDDAVRALADELLVLGPQISRVKEFIDLVRGVGETHTDSVKNIREKVYAGVLCEGIDEIVMEYEAAVGDLYHEADTAYMTIPQMSAVLGKWKETLPRVVALVGEVERRPAQILTIVDQTVRFSSCREVFAPLQKKLNELLLFHIASWVVWGVLPEQSGFFIESNTSKDGMHDADMTGVPQASSRARPRSDVELVSLFQPAYIPTHLAMMIVTVGQYARRMRQRTSSSASHADSDILLSEDAFTLFNCITSEEVLRPTGAVNCTLLEDIVQHTEKIVGYQLWVAVEQPLRYTMRGVGDYYLCFNGSLWRTFAVSALDLVGSFGAQVISHREATAALTLANIERQAARLREKLTSAFHAAYVAHKKSTSMAGAPATPKQSGASSSDRDLYDKITFSVLEEETAFQAALQKLMEPAAVENKFAQSLRFSNYMLATIKTMKLSAELDKRVEGLFDPHCRELLSNVFSHCMFLHQTEVMLASVWKSCVTATKCLRSEHRHQGSFAAAYDERVQRGMLLLKPLLLLKRKMSFFIDNMKFYIMTDVIHTKWARLQHDLASEVHTFDTARVEIKTCLQEISKDAFLVDPDKSNHLVLVTIRQAVRCCIQCWYVSYCCFEQPGRRDDVCRSMAALSDYPSVLSELSLSFDKCVRSLYQVLATNTQVDKYRQLLMRLNFNSYYSSEDHRLE